MRNKIFLSAILLTPILVVMLSSLYFMMGISPEGTKNNGVFFKSYFDLNEFKNIYGDQDLIKFDDGKWVLSVYVTDIEASKESIYLMRQLNVALNRDINKLKRVLFYSNKLLESDLEKIKSLYPRVELIEDKNGVLLNVLQRNSVLNFNINNPIFVIDPYGRAVMYFNPGTDPKLILKDLKVLI
ncbi:MAG: hypothetical protein CMD46_05640 [Gammaproteobacteria bacterium]|nr:hypothetical protein [Gammaproteobacteria bacterium]